MQEQQRQPLRKRLPNCIAHQFLYQQWYRSQKVFLSFLVLITSDPKTIQSLNVILTVTRKDQLLQRKFAQNNGDSMLRIVSQFIGAVELQNFQMMSN